MARADEYKSKTESPVKKYLSWSSNEKCFTYWDKESQSNKKMEVPFSFVHLSDMSCIKGWHDASSSGIYSNEVKNTTKEELNVRAFKGGDLIKGMYRDIKEKVNALGGDYHASIYGFANGEIVNISFKGASLKAWSDFATESRSLFLSSLINVSGALDAKKGSVKYSVPIFVIGTGISLSVSEEAEDAHTVLSNYFSARVVSAESHPLEVVAQETNIPKFEDAPVFEDNPLPF